MAKSLTRKQKIAIPLILSAKTLKEGLELAKVGKSTYYRWMEDPIFVEAFDKERRQVVDKAYLSLERAMGKSVEELVKLIDSQNESLRRRVCVDILTLHTHHVEVSELAKEIERIKQRLEIQIEQRQ